MSCRRSTPWLGGVTFVDRRRSIRQQPRRVAWRATSESVSDPDLVRAAASHRGTASAASVNGSVEPGRLRRLQFLLALWVRRNVGDLLYLSRQRFGWRGPANRRVCTRGRTRRSASYRALQSMGHGIHEAVPRLRGRWGALDDTATASADGIGGGISIRLPNARSTGRSMRTRCPNSGFCLLFSDPARLARIRVGVRDTSTLLVQVDANKAGRWNMAEIALLPRRLAEWSGTPPRWYPLQLGGC